MKRWISVLVWLFLPSFFMNAQDTFELNLDEETARPNIGGDGVFQESEGKLYYLNRISNNIKVFDLVSGNTLSTIPLFKAGPNKVGPQVETFFVLNKDSIFVFSEFFKNQVSLINSEGQVINQYATWPKEIESKYLGQQLSKKGGGIQVSMPYVYLSHFIYYLDTRQSFSSITKVDIRNGEVSFVDRVPKTGEFIDNSKIAILSSLLSPTIQMAADSRLIVNYPVSNDVFSFYEKKKGFDTHKAKSTTIEAIRLMTESLNDMGREQYEREIRVVSSLSGYYSNLFYDKFKNKFYRIVRIPYNEEVLMTYRQGILSKLPPYPFSIIELDENLNILSEWMDEKRVLQPERGVFVDERGLWVLELRAKDEDKMIFHKVKF